MSTPIVKSGTVFTVSRDGGAVTSLSYDNTHADSYVEEAFLSVAPRDYTRDRSVVITGNGTTTIQFSAGAITSADIGFRITFPGGWAGVVNPTSILSIVSTTQAIVSEIVPTGMDTVQLKIMPTLYLARPDLLGMQVYLGSESWSNRSVFKNTSTKDRKDLWTPFETEDTNDYSYGPCVFTRGSRTFTYPPAHLSLVLPGDLIFMETAGTWVVEGAVVESIGGGICVMDRHALVDFTENGGYPPLYIYRPVSRVLRRGHTVPVLDWIEAWADGGSVTGLSAYAVGGWSGGEPLGAIGEWGHAAGSKILVKAKYLGGMPIRSTTGWPTYDQIITPGATMALRAVAVGTPAEIHLRAGYHMETT